MIDVTVAVELTDDTASCRASVDSVLSQSGPDLEILLIGPDRDVAAPLCSDSRVRFHQAGRPLPDGRLLETLANKSAAMCVMILPPRSHLMPGALRTLVRELETPCACDMVFALQFTTDREGHALRELYHDAWDQASSLERFDAANPEDLLYCDFMPGAVRVFRRNALLSAFGKPGQRLNRHTLYGVLHACLKTRFLRQPVSIESGSRTPAGASRDRPGSVTARALSLLVSARHPSLPLRFRDVLPTVWERYRARRLETRYEQRLVRKTIWGFSAYRVLELMLRRVRLPDPRPVPGVAPGPKRVAYYIWQYPVFSQTFVQREVAALRRAGCNIVVFSDLDSDGGFIAALEPVLAGSDRQLPTLEEGDRQRLARRFFRQFPLRYLRLRLSVVGSRYHYTKSRKFDRATFSNALNLAMQAEKAGIQHLHAPWADRCAFVALLAARLIGISCSVQARAHDLHRVNYTIGLKQKFDEVDFIVTNTSYNVGCIRSIIGPGNGNKVSRVYNGLNLEQFNPRPRVRDDMSATRLLCVARLVEQKGIADLLRACRKLLDLGVDFQCDIVGGAESEGMNVYIGLVRLHRDLRLGNHVRFVGRVPFEQALAYQQSADVFVLPCVIAEDGSRDIIPNSVLEAMAMKLPVVSTHVTGLPEIVDHGETGFLVPPGDVDTLTGAIQMLIESPELRTRFGEKGCLKVQRMFDSRKNVLAYQKLFEGQSL